MDLNDVLGKLDGVVPSGKGYSAKCPAHDDHNASLHVQGGNAVDVVMWCFAGCKTYDIFDALGLSWKDSVPRPHVKGGKTTYPALDEKGLLMGMAWRQDQDGKKVKMGWRKPDGSSSLGGMSSANMPLYGATIVPAVRPEDFILFVEGQKAMDRAAEIGIPCVASQTGASGVPSVESLKLLKDRTVVLWPDNDDAGRDHMQRIGKALLKLGCKVQWYEWEDAPEKGDVADHPAVLQHEAREALVRELQRSELFNAPYDPLVDGPRTFAGDVSEMMKSFRRAKDSGGVPGMPTGIAGLDIKLLGLEKRHSYLVAAETGFGKSIMATEFALSTAEAGHRVLLAATEMSGRAYLQRMACKLAGVSFFAFSRGESSEEEAQEVERYGNYISNLPLFFDEYAALGTGHLQESIEHTEPDLVVIDYVQHLKVPGFEENRTGRLEEVSRQLSIMKKTQDFSLVMAAQFNRTIREEKEPTIHNIKGSSEFANDVDAVLALNRPDKGKVPGSEEEMEIICLKNREGETFRLPVYFVRNQQWLTDQNPYGYKAPRSAQEGISF